MKSAAKFTRDNPCTKVHLWNCFRGPSGFVPVPLVTAKSQIGDNAPKYLIREGYALQSSVGGVDYYTLTHHGVAWLEAGTRRHLELHPGDAALLRHPVPGAAVARPAATGPRVIRRAR